MTDRGMFSLLAMLAHECRATYMDNGKDILICEERTFNLRLTRVSELRYCLRASLLQRVIIGNRYSVGFSGYLLRISCMHFSHLMLNG